MLGSLIRRISEKTGLGKSVCGAKAQISAVPTENVSYNRQFWDHYASTWSSETVTSEDRTGATNIQLLGDEWGGRNDVAQIIQRFIFPWVKDSSVVAEIGPGGGRIASLVAPRVSKLCCYDTSINMLDRLKSVLSSSNNVEYTYVSGRELGTQREYFDFIYSFDVFVHLDLHTIWKYLIDIELALKPGGKAFLHTANLTAPEGWQRFQSQDAYDPLGFYFVTPDLMRFLAQKSGLRVVEETQPQSDNFYLRRDYMFLMEKPL